jgi:hypothetical protein
MRRRTTAVAGIVLAAGLSLGLPGTAGAADLDCKDFATQAQAQAVFNATPGDPNGLDRDKDGIACESLPGGTSGQAEDGTTFKATGQVSTRPLGAVAAGDGSASEQGSSLPYVLGGVALTGAAGAAFAARRSARARA